MTPIKIYEFTFLSCVLAIAPIWFTKIIITKFHTLQATWEPIVGLWFIWLLVVIFMYFFCFHKFHKK